MVFYSISYCRKPWGKITSGAFAPGGPLPVGPLARHCFHAKESESPGRSVATPPDHADMQRIFICENWKFSWKFL